MPAHHCRLLLILAGVMLLSACASSRNSLEYANVWDQAFAQSMKQPKKSDGAK